MENKIKSLVRKLTKFGYKVKSEESFYVDPVCGMKTTSGISSEHQGKMHYFCSAHCKAQFEEDPSAYT